MFTMTPAHIRCLKKRLGLKGVAPIDAPEQKNIAARINTNTSRMHWEISLRPWTYGPCLQALRLELNPDGEFVAPRIWQVPLPNTKPATVAAAMAKIRHWQRQADQGKSPGYQDLTTSDGEV